MPVDQNQFFREVTLRICGSLDIYSALSETLDYMKKLIPADSVGLGYADLEQERIRVVASATQEGAPFLWGDGASEIALSKETIEFLRMKPDDNPMFWIINRPEELDEELLAVFPNIKSHSAFFLRLYLSGEAVGILLISAEGHHRYSSEHADLLEMVREPFTIAMLNARRYQELLRIQELLVEDNRALSADLQHSVGVEVVGSDFGLREVMEQVRLIAPSSSPTLLLGETGTGKEVIANAIHMASPRNSGPMIAMQCGAIPETLLDSELFGYEKGAFTGASQRKRGRFERADGGTLFLDEIGELSSEAQVKLLRVLQEKRFERVGGCQSIEVDVRVIAATHRDLEKMVQEGTFREDLWYRLNVLPIRIPPLRLRREDIPSLVQYFVKRKVQEMNLTHIPQIESRSLERLKAYDWPGNVRELQNIVERSLILARGGLLTFPELAAKSSVQEAPSNTPTQGPILKMDEAIATHIRVALERVDWQVAGKGGAAELLDMKPSTLRSRMKKLDIKRKWYRS